MHISIEALLLTVAIVAMTCATCVFLLHMYPTPSLEECRCSIMIVTYRNTTRITICNIGSRVITRLIFIVNRHRIYMPVSMSPSACRVVESSSTVIPGIVECCCTNYCTFVTVPR
ncbi:MAG: hypothetical protein GXO26_09025 [Crenarchaeota archaeon]|nr:hypothetical protein [Thermoproteota archaeon]